MVDHPYFIISLLIGINEYESPVRRSHITDVVAHMLRIWLVMRLMLP